MPYGSYKTENIQNQSNNLKKFQLISQFKGGFK